MMYRLLKEGEWTIPGVTEWWDSRGGKWEPTDDPPYQINRGHVNHITPLWLPISKAKPVAPCVLLWPQNEHNAGHSACLFTAQENVDRVLLDWPTNTHWQPYDPPEPVKKTDEELYNEWRGHRPNMMDTLHAYFAGLAQGRKESAK